MGLKILHSADWHLDTPFVGHSPEQAACLRQALLQVPDQLSRLCRREGCDLVLLSGDLFDGPYSPESLQAVKTALKEANIPVFISPGNHDFVSLSSPWTQERWPENVHIFTSRTVESISLPELNCRVYGAAFTAMEDAGLLEDFHTQGEEKWHLGVFHGDPTMASSPYGAITAVLGYYGETRRLFTVPASAFLPAPKVNSAVVRMDLYQEPRYTPKDKKLFFSIIKAAFEMRRKTLVNAISAKLSYTKEEVADALAAIGLSDKIRGERLSTADFASLADALLKLK